MARLEPIRRFIRTTKNYRGTQRDIIKQGELAQRILDQLPLVEAELSEDGNLASGPSPAQSPAQVQPSPRSPGLRLSEPHPPNRPMTPAAKPAAVESPRNRHSVSQMLDPLARSLAVTRSKAQVETTNKGSHGGRDRFPVAMVVKFLF